MLQRLARLVVCEALNILDSLKPPTNSHATSQSKSAAVPPLCTPYVSRTTCEKS